MKIYKNLDSASKERRDVQALKISVKGESFPPHLLEFPNLEELYLEGSCKDFPPVPPSWEKLKVLSIKWPFFEGDLSSLFKLPSLTNLKIIETPFKSFLLPLGQIPAPLKFLTIKDCGLKSLPEDISMVYTVEEMNLSGNLLSKLPRGFEALTNLKRLNLDSNKFEKFPDSIKELPSLSHLSIDDNLFTDEEKARIHREFNLYLG